MLKRSKVKKEKEGKKIKEGDGKVDDFMGYIPTEKKLPHLNRVKEEGGDIATDNHIADSPKAGGKDYLSNNKGIKKIAKSLLVGVVFKMKVVFEKSVPKKEDDD